MARRTFDVIDVAEILVHWHAGRSLSEMAGSLGVDRKTLRKYVAPAVAAGIAPGGAAEGGGGGGEVGRRARLHGGRREAGGRAAGVAISPRYVNAKVREGARRSQVTVWNPHPAEA